MNSSAPRGSVFSLDRVLIRYGGCEEVPRVLVVVTRINFQVSKRALKGPRPRAAVLYQKPKAVPNVSNSGTLTGGYGARSPCTLLGTLGR